MKKILFVLRDTVPARIAIQLINLPKLCGHEIVVIAEGEAVSVCKDAGITLHKEGDVSMSQIMTASILSDINPSIVCIGCSSPINWELQFAWFARQNNVPVVAIADIWGALSRLKSDSGDIFIPDLALVIDDHDAMDTVRKRVAKNTKIIGDIASLSPPQMTPEKRVWFNEIRAGKRSVLIVADHTKNAIEVARITARAIKWEKNPSGIVVFASFVHPKLRDHHDIKPILVSAEEELSGLNYVRHEDISTDTLASLCDVTITCASTPGRIALHNGKRFLSVLGEASRKLLLEEMGTNRFLLERIGAVPVINGESSISTILSDDTYRQRGSGWARSNSFTPGFGVDAIIALLPK